MTNMKKTMAAVMSTLILLTGCASGTETGIKEEETVEEEKELTAQEYLGLAMEAQQNGDMAAAFENMAKAASMGDPTACGIMAEAYHNGDAGGVDYAKALEYAEIAYEGGDAKGTLYYGSIYLNGYGVEQDTEKGLAAIEKAYELGDKKAPRYLGYAYLRGTGVNQDSAKAAEWFEIGVEGGDYTSMIELGKLLVSGEGIEADTKRAEELFTKVATEREDHVGAPAMYELGKLAETAGDTEAAAQWYQKALDNGFEDAQAALDALK